MLVEDRAGLGLNFRMVSTETELSEIQLLPLKGELQKRYLGKNSHHSPWILVWTVQAHFHAEFLIVNTTGSQVGCICRCRTLVQRNWMCRRLVILSYTHVCCCAQGWCLWLSCMFWVNCSLLFRLFSPLSLDILILALGDPMYKSSLNIRSPRFHLAAYCWAMVGCAAVSADVH